jgi:large subunit ribosomal protein L19
MQRSILQHVEAKNIRQDVATFRTGDTVRVHWKVKEGEKERVQPFEGIVIRKTNGQNRATFTVRKVSYGVGVERIFPLHSPRYERIEVLTRSHVGRSRLFYLRNLRGKASRIQSEDVQQPSGPPAAAPTGAHQASEPASAEAAAAAEAEKPAAAPKAKKPKAAKAPKKE